LYLESELKSCLTSFCKKIELGDFSDTLQEKWFVVTALEERSDSLLGVVFREMLSDSSPHAKMTPSTASKSPKK